MMKLYLCPHYLSRLPRELQSQYHVFHARFLDHFRANLRRPFYLLFRLNT